MQSSRRKRDREEPAGGARTSSRGRGARGPKRSQNTSSLHVRDASQSQVKKQQVLQSSSSTPVQVNAAQGSNDQSEKEESAAPIPMEIDESESQVTSSVNANRSVGDENEGNKDSRQQQLARLVSHRKVLLERVRKCRAAARTRLERNAQTPRQKRPLAAPSDIGSTEAQDSATLSGKTETKSDDSLTQQSLSSSDEIEEFRELTRLANQAVKKHRATTEPPAEKRVSVSLRRGSNVGKKMNTALSSLAPGGGAHPAVATEASTVSMSKPQTLAPLAPPASLTPPPGALASRKQSLITNPSKRAVHAISGVSVDAVGPGRPPAGQKGAKRTSQKATNAGAVAPARQPVSAFQSKAKSLPLNATTGASGVPPNQLMVPRSSVYFPEAHSLRERRAVIRAKLTALLRARQETQSTSRTPWEWPSGSTVPTRLPNRRKTHWDYLLEEMRWLATDFVEERKWKESSARILASAVLASNANSVSPGALEPGREANKGDNGENHESSSEVQRIDSPTEASSQWNGGNVPAKISREYREYIQPTSSDFKALRTIATSISVMITDLWDITVESGAFSKSDTPHRATLPQIVSTQEKNNEGKGILAEDSHKQSRKENESGSTPELSSEVPHPSDMDIDSGNAQCTASADQVPESVPLDEINALIKSTINRITGRKARRSRAKTFDESVSLTLEQRKSIDFFEYVWNGDDRAGAILNGSSGSGKTLVACSLLWRHRENGPQLLVCSPARLVRWTHELNRFPGIKVRVFGASGGVSSPCSLDFLVSAYDAADVVVCEFSSLLGNSDDGRKETVDLSSFYSVLIDSRHPLESLYRLRKHVSGKGDDTVSQNYPKVPTQRLIPAQLLTRTWWASILDSLGRTDVKRLFIENRGYLNQLGEDGNVYDVLSKKQYVEFLASKAAFVLGPNVFADKKASSVQHKVVSWAKHNVRDLHDDGKTKFERVVNYLKDSMASFRHSVDSAEDASAAECDVLDWEIRLCSLTELQRAEYDKCCFGVRGGLSLDNIVNASDQVSIIESSRQAAKALLRLRNVCVHPQMKRLTTKKQAFNSLSRQNITGIPFERSISCSASQPNDDIAIEILQGSAKLRELTMILRDTCGFQISSAAVSRLLPKKSGRGSSRREVHTEKGEIRKVAILATLPEAQVLTSQLLNAIGISHELLVRSPITSKMTAPSKRPWPWVSMKGRMDGSADSLAWIESQIALSEFNYIAPPLGDADIKSKSPMGLTQCNVLVSSPMTVGADYGGLGIESAQLVLCLDEDWSGREEYLMGRIVNRCSLAFQRSWQAGQNNNRRMPNGLSDCRLIKLVCKGTCEEKFIAESSSREEKMETTANGPRLQWHINAFGCLSLPDTEATIDSSLLDERDSSDILSEYETLRPGNNFLAFRDKDLSEVLGTADTLPPHFASGRLMKFLPFVRNESACSALDASIEANLLRNLLDLENHACFLNTIGMPYPEDGHSMASALIPKKMASFVNILPPRPEDLPETAMGRHDLSVISSRVFVENFGRFLVSVGGTAPFQTESSSAELGFSLLSEVPTEAVPSENTDLVDAWQKSGLNSKRGDVALSLLMYSSNGSDVPRDSASDDISATVTQTVSGGTSLVQRLIPAPANGEMFESGCCGTRGISLGSHALSNEFAETFSQWRTVLRDGNQGSEPFVYFPPRFPGTLPTAKRIKLELNEATQSTRPEDLSFSDDAKKRKAVSSVIVERNTKRPRVEAFPAAKTDQTAARPAAVIAQRSPSAHHKMVVSGPVLHEEKGKSPLALESSLVTEDEASRVDSPSVLPDVGEDYGMLGIGALTLPEYSLREASLSDTNGVSYLNCIDSCDPTAGDHDVDRFTLPCDSEEAEGSRQAGHSFGQLSAMVLLVTRRANASGLAPAVQANPSDQSIFGSMQGTKFSWPILSAPNIAPTAGLYGLGLTANGTDPMTNGAGSVKKGKKRVPSTHTSDTLALQSSADQAARASRDKQKILASVLGRQGSSGMSLFQSPLFRLASLRNRKRVLFRLSEASLTQFGASPGVGFPSERGSEWASVSRRRTWAPAVLKVDSSASMTGDDAKSKSLAEKAIIRKSPTFPARVDLGPFQVGYISSRSGIAGIPPVRQRMGIRLPMGVKHTHTAADSSQPWTAKEDEALRDYSRRFGLNWHLLANAVNGIIDYAAGDKPRQHQRSARECRDRWYSLAEEDKSLAKQLPKTVGTGHRSEKQGMLASRTGRSQRQESQSDNEQLKGVSLLLPSSFVKPDQDSESMQVDTEKEAPGKADCEKPSPSPRRSFALLRRASSRKHDIPMRIPGFASGDKKPSLVPPNESHAQAVESAVLSLPGSGADLWPLQLLEIRGRSSRIRATSTTQLSSSSQPHHAPSALQPPGSFAPPTSRSSPARQPRP